MKNLILLVLFLFAFGSANAQDQAIFTQYHISPILINPGATGFNEKNNLMMNLRSQWAGFPGAPKTYSVGYHGPLGRTMGIGANLLSEKIASLDRLRFQLNYAFRYQIGEDVKLGMGFSTEFQSIRLARTTNENPLIESERLVSDYIDGVNIFDATLGFYGTIKEKTHIGLSFPNLVVARLGEIAGSEPEGGFLKYFIFDMGHKLDFEGAGVSLEPSIMVRKTLNSPFQIDFNTVAGFLSDQLFAGLSYRSGTGGAVGILLGGKISSVKIFYGFDLSFAKFQEYNSGTHEITAAFEFSKWNKSEYDKSKKYK
ncbi:MAG: type IX secretion system PorP/SprF family membrane protein [Saprospiraceae bacterium]|jgi:type IX secretion system PorP/SprF family membrane protein